MSMELCKLCVEKNLPKCQLEAGRQQVDRNTDLALQLFKEMNPPHVSAIDDPETQKILNDRNTFFRGLSEEAKKRGCVLLRSNIPYAV